MHELEIVGSSMRRAKLPKAVDITFPEINPTWDSARRQPPPGQGIVSAARSWMILAGVREGTRRMSLSSLLRIASIFDVTPSALLERLGVAVEGDQQHQVTEAKR